MTTLIVTLMLGARIYAGDFGACDPACDPCGACTDCNGKSCDLFSGLKRLAACNPCDEAAACDPCDAVVACSPCDMSDVDACGICDDSGNRRGTFGKRLRDLFADKGCDPCGDALDCDPCGDLSDCGACDETACGDAACKRGGFKLRNLFKGLSGRCSDGCCDPCEACGDLSDCGACDDAAACDPCGDLSDCGACDDSCSPKFGKLLDKPRRNMKKLFDGLFCNDGCDTGCDPCDAAGACDPICDACGDVAHYSAPATSVLPEAAN